MAAERVENSLKPGPALQGFIKEKEEEAIRAGKDPQVEALRALIKNSNKVQELIQSDIKNIGSSSTSRE